MVEHHALLYADLADPVALLRGERGAARARAATGPMPGAAARRAGRRAASPAYSALMAASQPLVADEVLDAYPLARHRCLLDVGGGDGALPRRAAARARRVCG